MQLRYFVPFKAQEGVSAEYALKEKLINIEGIAIDTSVNANKWQVPGEDLDFVVQSLMGAQLRVDHAESALMVVGKVPEAKRDGDRVLFRAEVGEEKLIEKILRNYVTHVSIQVDSDDVECSKCKKPTRKEGMLVHLCPGAWEIVHKPKVRELSIVASPAYEKTQFTPMGFAAAMNDNQFEAMSKGVDVLSLIAEAAAMGPKSQLSEDNKNVGSKGDLQEPENQKLEAKTEVRHLSEHDAQQGASPHQAQGVVNVAPGETAPKQVEYQDLMDKLTNLQKQIMTAGEADIDALKKQVADLEAEVAKRATKKSLSKKISDLQKQLQQQPEEKGEEGEAEASQEAEAGAKGIEMAPKAEVEGSKLASGKGIVAVDELKKDMAGPDYDWFFKDILKAHKILRTEGFKG
jgi:polyhydroxyalkanoate synthesis regulator phasin